MHAIDEPELVDIQGASRISCVPVGTLRAYRQQNKGPAGFVLAGRLVYRVSELRDWIEQQERDTRRGGPAQRD